MNKNAQMAVLFLGGFAGGAVVGYFVAQKRLEKQYRAIADEEIASVKKTYSSATVHVPNQKDKSPEEMVDGILGPETLAALAAYSGQAIQDPGEKTDVEESIETAEDKVEYHNVFADNEVRDRTKPYMISTEEFMNDKEDYDKITVTYYVEDDTLCDEQDQLVPSIDDTVGSANMSKFGDGDEPDVIYVRNEGIETDFEVIRNEGSYSKSVLGLGDEFLEHSDRPRNRKFRQDDWDHR